MRTRRECMMEGLFGRLVAVAWAKKTYMSRPGQMAASGSVDGPILGQWPEGRETIGQFGGQ